MGDFRRGQTMDNKQRQSGALEAGAHCGVLFFLGGCGNLGVLVVLIFTAGWWAAPKPTRRPSLGARSPRWFWPLIVAAMIFCGVAASMRMNYGFAHDEDYSARQVIAGSYKVGPDGKVSPREAQVDGDFVLLSQTQ